MPVCGGYCGGAENYSVYHARHGVRGLARKEQRAVDRACQLAPRIAFPHRRRAATRNQNNFNRMTSLIQPVRAADVGVSIEGREGAADKEGGSRGVKHALQLLVELGKDLLLGLDVLRARLVQRGKRNHHKGALAVRLAHVVEPELRRVSGLE